jgi:hypothetical protein
MTSLSRYFTEIFDVDKSKLELLYVSKEDRYGGMTILPKQVPIFWAHYEDKLLYVVVEYDLHFLEVFYDDWKHPDGSFFNPYSPTEKELSYLSKYNFYYFIVDPQVFLVKEIRDEICQWEEDIIKTWSRNNKINQIFNGKE